MIVGYTKSGVNVNVCGTTIFCSNGKTYHWSGNMLIGPSGSVQYNVRSMNEAVGIVIGLNGGKQY